MAITTMGAVSSRLLSAATDQSPTRAPPQPTEFAFITRVARKIVEAGGSLRDVQELAGHASLSTTQRYIQGDSAAKRRVVIM
jgi:site-specific recombinase XerC